MTQISPPARNTMRKNNQSDWLEGFEIVRTITAADTPAALQTSIIPGFCSIQPADSVFAACSARTIQYRIFSNVSGGTVSLQFLSEAPKGPKRRSDSENEMTVSVPTTLIAIAITCSGASTVNRNPITGVPDSNTWYEASTWTAAFTNDNRVTEYPSGSASSYQKFFAVDNMGDALCFPYCYAAPSSSGTVIVAARRVD